MRHYLIAISLALLACTIATAGQIDVGETLKQAQKLEFDQGKRKEALELYRQIVQKDPARFDAHLGIGRILNVDGKYSEARQHIQKAIEAAPDTGLNPALSTMAISYLFEANVTEAAKYYQQVFDRQLAAGAPDAAAGTANALARAYLETGDPANAEKWYRTGYETAKKISKLTPEQSDLWEMRWHHALARIAARRKQFEVARKHVSEVQAIVSRGRLDEAQQSQYPHVAGYVAFYESEFSKAIAELSKADQNDVFVMSLLAQSYERTKEPAKARELYQKIVEAPGHSLQLAFSRPLAQRRLQAGGQRR